MKAMVQMQTCDLRHAEDPLVLCDWKEPEPGPGEILIQVSACGVCHTELDVIEGRTPPSRYPVIPGHQIVGRIIGMDEGVRDFDTGDRVGVGWIYNTCGTCVFCRSGLENLCTDFRATGRDAHGGYAERVAVPSRSVYRIPDGLTDIEAAPLLCAGAIGYRALNLAGLKNGQTLGLTGFGASGHLVLKMARYRYPDSAVFVFARRERERRFALELGAQWAGDTDDTAPHPCDALIDTTPAWKPVVEALRNLNRNGRLVINAIRKGDADRDNLLRLDYPVHLWMEKEIKSVANITRNDIREFLDLAAEIPIRPEVERYAFWDANRALHDLNAGRIRGAKVLEIQSGAAMDP
ncbi:MAG TPA: zinc-binding alcohol dehydrogenase family protein [bacterium]|nr:zinc-binding alcohol dehydrogenase family protein [bacterium]